MLSSVTNIGGVFCGLFDGIFSCSWAKMDGSTLIGVKYAPTIAAGWRVVFL